LKITDISWQAFAIPFKRPYEISQGTATIRYGLLLFLKNDEGETGIGEASPVGVGSLGEIEDIASEIKRVGIQILDAEFVQTEDIFIPIFNNTLPHLRFGLETALLDLFGKEQGCSISELLGGVPKAVPVNSLIAATRPQAAAFEAKEAIANGYATLKLKVAHGTLEQDQTLLQMVRDSIGMDIKLRIDPNQAWEVSQAIEAIQILEQYGIEYVEQPTNAQDLPGMVEVKRNSTVPIAADESITSFASFEKLLDVNAADTLILKPARIGSIRQTKKILERGIISGKSAVITTSLESGVGIAGCAHLAICLPDSPLAHGLATGPLLEEDLLSVSPTINRGMFTLPLSNGLGVEVNMDALKRRSIDISGSIHSSH
jgi:o-succinylbenzoate synthase